MEIIPAVKNRVAKTNATPLNEVQNMNVGDKMDMIAGKFLKV